MVSHPKLVTHVEGDPSMPTNTKVLIYEENASFAGGLDSC